MTWPSHCVSLVICASLPCNNQRVSCSQFRGKLDRLVYSLKVPRMALSPQQAWTLTVSSSALSKTIEKRLHSPNAPAIPSSRFWRTDIRRPSSASSSGPQSEWRPQMINCRTIYLESRISPLDWIRGTIRVKNKANGRRPSLQPCSHRTCPCRSFQWKVNRYWRALAETAV